jgi:hypothetical protein
LEVSNAPTVIHPCLEGNGSFAKTASAGQTTDKGVSRKETPFLFLGGGTARPSVSVFHPVSLWNSIAWQATVILSVFRFAETPYESFPLVPLLSRREEPEFFALWAIKPGFLHKNHNYR